MTAEKVAFVTGATGFIGGHLAVRLGQEGYRVRCLVRVGSQLRPDLEPTVEPVAGDLSNTEALRQGARGATVLFHCAAKVSDWATVEELRQTNVEGTKNVVRAALEAQVARVVHVSTTDVYRHTGKTGVDEETATDAPFSNWYSQTKAEAEECVRVLAGRSRLEAVILRPATVFGPGSLDVIGEIAKALRSRSMLLIARGQRVAGLCYVDNLVDALLLAAEHEAAAGQAFNVSDGLGVTWRQFLDDLSEALQLPKARLNLPYRPAFLLGSALECGYRALRKVTGLRCPPLLSRQAVEVMGVDQDFSIERARAVLGFSPRVDYDQAVARTAAWTKEHVL